MMKLFMKWTGYLLFALMIFSCNTTSKKNKDVRGDTKINQENKTYVIDTSWSSLSWTAYKFTEKVGVKGTFDEYSLFTNKGARSIEGLLKGNKITINTLSVNSGDGVRDAKLITYFFKTFKTDTINGELLDAKNGKGILALEMNSIIDTVDYTYSQKADTLLVTTAINLSFWEGEEAMNSLNRECYELHMGADKVSKLWPNVDILMKLSLD
ncbi:MAG: hypothetical protein WBG90_15015 [Saonia sp.]